MGSVLYVKITQHAHVFSKLTEFPIGSTVQGIKYLSHEHVKYFSLCCIFQVI